MLKKHKISLQKKGLAHLVFLLGFAAPIVTSSLVTVPKAIAQPIRKAVVFAPPSNIRVISKGRVYRSRISIYSSFRNDEKAIFWRSSFDRSYF